MPINQYIKHTSNKYLPKQPFNPIHSREAADKIICNKIYVFIMTVEIGLILKKKLTGLHLDTPNKKLKWLIVTICGRFTDYRYTQFFSTNYIVV